jgi:hypothetical protein
MAQGKTSGPTKIIRRITNRSGFKNTYLGVYWSGLRLFFFNLQCNNNCKVKRGRFLTTELNILQTGEIVKDRLFCNFAGNFYL